MPGMITDKQRSRLQAEYKRLNAEGDPRATLPVAHRAKFKTEREARLGWAQWHLQLRIAPHSFDDLTLVQACYLLDVLAGKATHLDQALDREWERLNVQDRAGYFNAMRTAAHSVNRWTFGARQLHELHRDDKIRLLQMLKTRAPKLNRQTNGEAMFAHADCRDQLG